MSRTCAVQRLGLVDYEEAWRLQDELAEEIGRGERPPTLLLLEHPHTYTFGRSGHADNLIWNEEQLKEKGIHLYWVDRGGDVTYHGPGQLVGYPLLPLAPIRHSMLESAEGAATSLHLPTADYIGYLRKLEEVLITALAKFGVKAGRIEGLTGVWVPQSDGERQSAKIAAIGVKVDARGISRHGFALNVNPDMTYWQGIIGCGLKGYPVTCLAALLDSGPRMETVMAAVMAAFGQVFGYKMKV